MKVDFEKGRGRMDFVAEPKAQLPPTLDASAVRHRRLILAVATSFALLAVIILARPSYHLATKWRAHWLAASAFEHAQKRDLDKALFQAQAAYQLRPDDGDVVRILARVLSLRHDANAFLFWQSLANSPAATPDDRRSFVESALEQRLIAPAVEELRTLLTTEPNSAQNYLLAAKLNALSGDRQGSLACAQKARELDASNEEAALFLASVEMASPDTRTAGLLLLWSLVDGNSATGLSAAVLAAQQKDMSPSQQDHLIQRLKNHPLANESERLLMLELELQRHPDQHDALLQNATSSCRANGGESLRQFGVWLNTHGESAWTVKAIPVDQAITRKDFFLVYLDALAGQKKWREINDLLSQPKLPLEPAYLEMFKSRGCAETGDRDGAEQHWRLAQLAAAKTADIGHPEQAFYLGNYAEKLGQLDQAITLYRTLGKSPLTARPAYEALLRIAVAKGTRPTRDLLREMLARWPADVAIQNDHAYLNLLLDEEIESSREKALELVKKFPNSLPHLTTLALAELRSGTPAAALKMYENLPIAWGKASAPNVAVYAAVLNANGRTGEARKLAGAIFPASLRPEEQALIGIGSWQIKNDE